MGSEAKRRATYQDVLDASEPVAEIIDGVLYTQPRPRVRHARAASRLGMLLGATLDPGDADPRGWVVLDEPELHLGADIVVPDLAAWRRERFPVEDPDAAFVAVAPDWVCEVLSGSTASKDRTLKLPLYARAGVGWSWLLDPVTRVLEIYALDQGIWRLVGSHADDAVVCAAPFESVPVEMAKLWRV